MLKPLHNYVLLQRIEEENKTASGIIIPDNAREKPSMGVVISVGPGEWNAINGNTRVLSLKPGDKVLFVKWASSTSEIKLEGRDYILIRETDILGILK
jgi:chaperonin GroES